MISGALSRRVSNVIHSEVTKQRVTRLIPLNYSVASCRFQTFHHQSYLNRNYQQYDPDEYFGNDSDHYDMPPKAKKRQSEKYKNDGGFVEDGEPSSKRSKVELGKRATDQKGDPYWEIGGRLRRVGVSEYLGKILVDIRECYEQDGKVLKGKKGISLTVEQLNVFLSVLPQIEQHLADKGVVIGRPEYSGSAAQQEEVPEEKAVKEEAEEEAEEEQQEENPKEKAK